MEAIPRRPDCNTFIRRSCISVVGTLAIEPLAEPRQGIRDVVPRGYVVYEYVGARPSLWIVIERAQIYHYHLGKFSRLHYKA